MNGEKQLRHSLRRLRQQKAAAQREPVNVEPANVFEYHVITRLNELEEDIAALKSSHDWLLRLVVGGFVAAILELLLS